MKTKTNTLTSNSQNPTRSLIGSIAIAALLSLLFIKLTDKIDTGIDLAMFNQQTYNLNFLG